MLGQGTAEVAEVAQDGWQAGGEEESEDAGDDEQKDDDRADARRMASADAEERDPADDGHEDDGEERADVEDEELFTQGEGEGKEKQDADGEEDVAADRGARLLLEGSEVAGVGEFFGVRARVQRMLLEGRSNSLQRDADGRPFIRNFDGYILRVCGHQRRECPGLLVKHA